MEYKKYLNANSAFKHSRIINLLQRQRYPLQLYKSKRNGRLIFTGASVKT